jgi:hypothetical protein
MHIMERMIETDGWGVEGEEEARLETKEEEAEEITSTSLQMNFNFSNRARLLEAEAGQEVEEAIL